MNAAVIRIPKRASHRTGRVPRAPFTPCTGEEGDEDIELEIGRSSSSEIVAKFSKPITRCPREVIKWTKTKADIFEVTVNKSKNVIVKQVQNSKSASNSCSKCLAQRNFNRWCETGDPFKSYCSNSLEEMAIHNALEEKNYGL